MAETACFLPLSDLQRTGCACCSAGVEEVPPELEYIVYELSVIRFNRIGSEGMSAHSVEGESISFSDDDFLRFQSDIDAYLDSVSESKWGKVTFQ